MRDEQYQLNSRSYKLIIIWTTMEISCSHKYILKNMGAVKSNSILAQKLHNLLLLYLERRLENEILPSDPYGIYQANEVLEILNRQHLESKKQGVCYSFYNI